jgi:hypothetical protein
MLYSIDAIAAVCHEANRQLQRLNGEVVNFPWENTSEDMRESVRIGVRGILAGNTPEQSHESWIATKMDQGWVFGPVKDFGKRTHPNLVAYDQLPPKERIKDSLFSSIVQALATAQV